MNLAEIVESVIPEVASMRGVKLYKRKPRHGFKSDSPKSVDRISNLATCLYVGGDKGAAIKLYEFLDRNVDSSWTARRDLAGSISMVRLLLVYIYNSDNLSVQANEILSRDDLSATQNLESYDVIEYENTLQDRLQDNHRQFEFYENDEETGYSDKLRIAINCYQEMILLTVRLPEIVDTSFESDIEKLPESLNYFREKVLFYLTHE